MLIHISIPKETYSFVISQWGAEGRSGSPVPSLDPCTTLLQYTVHAFFDFSLTVKAAPHECTIRTGQP